MSVWVELVLLYLYEVFGLCVDQMRSINLELMGYGMCNRRVVW